MSAIFYYHTCVFVNHFLNRSLISYSGATEHFGVPNLIDDHVSTIITVGLFVAKHERSQKATYIF